MRWRVKHIFISKDLFDYNPETTTFEQWVNADMQAGEQINDFYQSLEEQGELVFATKLSGYTIKGGSIIVLQCYTVPLLSSTAQFSSNSARNNHDYIEKHGGWEGASRWDEQLDRLMKDVGEDGV